MRDFRDAKTMAQTIRAALAAKGHKITISESLELIAKAFGVADWNTLSAAVKAAEADRQGSSSTLDTSEKRQSPGGMGFHANLDATLHRAVKLANDRKHEYATLEHLLLALIDDPDAAAVMNACDVTMAELRATLVNFLDSQIGSTSGDDAPWEAKPTQAFQRVIQRAVIHVQASGRYQITGANALVAIYSERESHAARFLQEQEMTRYDAVNFIAHGIRKGGRAA
jgi:hypothetical protein